VRLLTTEPLRPAAEPFGMLANDGLARALQGLLLVVALCVVALGEPLMDRLRLARGDFHALLLASVSGMQLLVSAQDLLLFFLGIELLSLPLYVMAAFRRLAPASVESGFKYFLLGAFASGFLVYGIALIYGATGTTSYRALGSFAASARPSTLWHVGLAMVLVAAGFKAALAPFHTWTPDVYQGAPTPVTALMAAGVKTAAFGALVRLARDVLPASEPMLRGLVVVACLSMTVGNLGALLQTNLKRLLAWSSVGHAGYLLVGVLATVANRGGSGASAVLFYLGTYALTTLAAFAIVERLGRETGAFEDVRALRGLARSRPLTALALALCLLSLAGVPPTAGFVGKLYLVRALWSAGDEYAVAALFLVGTSVIGLGYYLKVVAAMYMEPEGERPLVTFESIGATLVTAAATIAVVWFGVWPSTLLEWLHT
jgi:NADH-quinone oxidoreductase subunit N